MFARLTKFQIKVEKVDDGIKLYETSVVPASKTQKRYCGVHLLIDRKTGNGCAITLWDREEDAIANEKNLYYQEQLIKFLNFITKPYIREGYEVVIKD